MSVFATLACSRQPDANVHASSAPGCVALDAPAAVDSTAVQQDLSAGRRYRCVLHAGDAPLQVDLVGNAATKAVDSVQVRRDDGTLIQTLTPGADEPPFRGAEPFRAVDFDGDGRVELALLVSWGVTGNEYWNVWRQDPSTGRFAMDSTLSALSLPVPVADRPCVQSYANGGAAGMLYDSVLVCRAGDRWVETRTASSEQGPTPNLFLHTVRERRGDSLVVVRRDTVRDTTP